MPKLEIRYTKSFEEQFEKEGMHEIGRAHV